MKNSSINTSFEISDDLNDTFIAFLESNSWLLIHTEGFPTIDSVDHIYEKEGVQLKVEMEHWCKTNVSGNKTVVDELESKFKSFLNQGSDQGKSLSKDEVFKPIEYNDSLKLKTFIRQIKFGDIIYPTLLSLFFILPIALWISSRARFTPWEIVLILLLIAVYLIIGYIQVKAIGTRIRENQLYLSSIDRLKTSLKKTIKFRSTGLNKSDGTKPILDNLFSKSYQKSFSNIYSFNIADLSLCIGDLEAAITRQYNSKIGRQVTSRKSFLLIETSSEFEIQKLPQTKDVLQFVNKNLGIDLKVLEMLDLTGVAQGRAIIIFFEQLIENPRMKLAILQQVLEQMENEHSQTKNKGH